MIEESYYYNFVDVFVIMLPAMGFSPRKLKILATSLAVGIERYSDPSVCLSVCPSVGCMHAGCVAQLPSLSARWLPAAGRPPEMCGLRARPRTNVDPPRVELHRRVGGYRLAAPGAITCFVLDW